MGIIFKLLCPGDVPSKANKLILNSTTRVLYKHICFEEHHTDVIYDLWNFDYTGYPLIDNITDELIQYPVYPIWGEYDYWHMIGKFCSGNCCLLIA